MAQGTNEILWLRSLLTELGFLVTDSSYLFCDNKSTIMLSFNSVLHERTKHIEAEAKISISPSLRGSVGIRN